MYEVSVTGQFESDIGSGQKRFYDFSLKELKRIS